MAYRLTAAAERDLVRMFEEGIRLFGHAQADRYRREIEATFASLALNPGMGRERRDIEPPVRLHPHGSHQIVYRIDENGVLILRVRHGREDWWRSPA